MNSSPQLEIRDKFFENFIAFRTYSEMKQLITPLQHLEVKNFDVRIHYFDGRFSELNNNPQFTQQYHAKGMVNESYGAHYFLPDKIFLEKSIFDGTAYCQQHRSHVEQVKELFKRFFFSTAIAIPQYYSDRYEEFIFRFSSDQENQLMDFMVHRAALLYRFVQYFKDRGKSLLEMARKSSIQLPWIPTCFGDHEKSLTADSSLQEVQQFLRKTNCKRWHLSPLYVTEHLTARELDIISLLSKGKSLVQIRRQLKISEMTAAYHMKNIKKKLGSRTLFDLGFKLGKTVSTELGLEGL